MKKTITALILVVLLAVQAFSVYASGSIGCTVEKSDMEGQLRHQVTVRGNAGCEESSFVSLEVEQTDGTVVVLEQEKTDASGNFIFTFDLTLSGEFTAHVNSYSGQELLSVGLKILSQQEYQDIIGLFNKADADAAQYEEYMETYQAELGVDTTYYDTAGEIKEKILERMLRHKGQYTLYNVNELFEKSILFAYLYDSQDYAKIKETMQYYERYFGFSDLEYPKNMYQSYLNFSESVQNTVLKKVQLLKTEDLKEIQEKFFEAIALTAFYDLDNTEADRFLTENMDYMKFDGYTDCTKLRRWEILTSIKKAGTAKSLEELQKLYKTASAPVTMPPPTKKPGNGSGSSSGGGVSYGKPTPTPVPPQTQLPVVAEKDIFTDLDAVPWAKEAILELYKNNIVVGKEKGKFFPQDAVTRGEFAKLVVCAFDCYDENAKNKFSDANGKWFDSYASSAAENGYISGFEDGTFHGDDSITRQDMAVILYRVLSKEKLAGNVEVLKNPFHDFQDISGYAQNSVLMLANLNLLSGMEDGRFAPLEQATRAEVCALLCRVRKGGNTE